MVRSVFLVAFRSTVSVAVRDEMNDKCYNRIPAVLSFFGLASVDKKVFRRLDATRKLCTHISGKTIGLIFE